MTKLDAIIPKLTNNNETDFNITVRNKVNIATQKEMSSNKQSLELLITQYSY